MTVLVDAIYCDEIRLEASNKLIVIGVYDDTLSAGTLENGIQLTIWLRFFGLEEGTHKNTISLFLDDEPIFKVDGEMLADGVNVAQAYVQKAVLDIQREGILRTVIDLVGREPLHAPSLKIALKA
jgi:hypothetical protein